MSSIKPIGGRGHVAPYTTSVIRVPDPLIPDIQKMIDEYREKVLLGLTVENLTPINPQNNNCFGKSQDELIDLAHKVLKGRKNAKLSLQKLLQLICDNPNIKF